jgi:hypothetical protein
VKKARITRASAEEIQAMRDRDESRSDWKAAERLTPAEVERLAEEDDGPLSDCRETATVHKSS